jgi:alpha-glucosidase
LLLLALPGAVFLYQGQELGLEEVDLPDEWRRDPIFFRTGGERLGRDGCRVPIPWAAELPAFGFSTGEPWLPQPASFAAHAVSAEPSMLALTRDAIAARPAGRFAWLDSPPGTLVFARDGMVCAVNVDGAPLPVPAGSVVLASEPLGGTIPPGAAAWVA